MKHDEYIERYTPINVVFVLDTSGSMSNADLDAMITATKQAGNMILNANPDNRVAVVYYDHEARLAGKWDWVNPSNVAKTLDTLTRPNTQYYTNIVAGLNLAKKLLDEAPNKDTAKPVIVLMTDGAPNCYYTNSASTGDTGRVEHTDTRTYPNAANGDEQSVAMTIACAAEIADTGVSIYTVGYNVSGKVLPWIVLNPSNDITGFVAPTVDRVPVKTTWSTNSMTLNFIGNGIRNNNQNGEHAVSISAIPSGTTPTQKLMDEKEAYYKYTEKFYAPLKPEDLIDSFKEVVNFITTDLASPIKAGENLVITDVIDEGFVFDVEQSIAGAIAIQVGNVYLWTITDSLSVSFGTAVAYNADTRTVMWTIPASQLCLFDPSTWNAGDAPYRAADDVVDKLNKVTFVVTAIGQPLSDDIDNYNGKSYYTNVEAYSEYVNYNGKSISSELANNGWVIYEFLNQKGGDFRVKKFVDNGELIMALSDWSLTNDDFGMLRGLITFELYSSDIAGRQRQSDPVVTGTIGADGMITFSEKVESGWYLLRETVRGRAAEIFEAHDDWCFYFYASEGYVVGHSTAFNYDSLYTIINGYSYPGYRNLGYPGLNNNGDLFYIGITNGVIAD